MATLRFTANIQRHVPCPDAVVPGATVGAVLDAYFRTHTRARSYVLDDRGRAWFVPAVKDELRYPAHGRVVVTRTRDGGGTFETLTRGLPQEHAYDLVYRHALDVDEHGRSLMFGSTTGSLWASDDEGDSWETVSAHLPPIYAVTFEKSV
jgi:hypothetical protein